MPLQNRVTPWSTIVAHPARYPDPTAVFGNRGCLHGVQRNLLKPHHGKMWLACKLHVTRTRKVQRDDNRAFNGRKRILMTPRRYTELFFLDEPTAMAAGHRPCACCRRHDYERFLECWTRAFARSEKWTAPQIDDVLHGERLAADGTKVTHTASLASLPDGVLLSLTDESEREQRSDASVGDSRGASAGEDDVWLLWERRLHRWSHEGYVEHLSIGDRERWPPTRTVRVLTPPSLVRTLEVGFAPGMPHVSARQ